MAAHVDVRDRRFDLRHVACDALIAGADALFDRCLVFRVPVDDHQMLNFTLLRFLGEMPGECIKAEQRSLRDCLRRGLRGDTVNTNAY